MKDNEDAAPSVGTRILEQLPADARTRINKIAAEKDIGNGLTPTAEGSDAVWLAAQLSTLIDRDDFFDEAAWKKVRLRAEARKVAEKGRGQSQWLRARAFNAWPPRSGVSGNAERSCQSRGTPGLSWI